jgi:hypothetical protein
MILSGARELLPRSPGHPFHGPYHDREYGFPVRGDSALFERLALEINQAGLSWLTMLQKRERGADSCAIPGSFEIGSRSRRSSRTPAGSRRSERPTARFQVARRAPPSVAGELAEAFQADFRLYRRRDRERVSREYGIPARRAHAELLSEGGEKKTRVDDTSPSLTVAFVCSGAWLTPPARGSAGCGLDHEPGPLAPLRLPQRESFRSVTSRNLSRCDPLTRELSLLFAAREVSRSNRGRRRAPREPAAVERVSASREGDVTSAARTP